MSWGLQLKKDDEGKVEIVSVSGANNMPDFINLSGHTYDGPGSAGDTISVSASKKAPNN